MMKQNACMCKTEQAHRINRYLLVSFKRLTVYTRNACPDFFPNYVRFPQGTFKHFCRKCVVNYVTD